MSYWNPSANPQHASNNWFNPRPGAGDQAQFATNYGATGNTLMEGMGVNYQNSLINQQSADEHRLTGLQNQLLDLQAGGARRDTASKAASLANQLGGIGPEKAWRTTQLHLAEQAYNNAITGYQQNYNIAQGRANVAETGARNEYKQNLYSLYSGATAKGAGTANTGVRTGKGFLGNQLTNALQAVGLSRKEAKNQLDQGYRAAKNDLGTAQNNYRHYIQQLDQDARELGIQKGALNNALNQALSEAGLRKSVNLQQLAADLHSNDVQKQKNAQAVWGPLLQYAQTQQGRNQILPQSQRQSATLGRGVF